jgi:chemotaxis protein histidine kinase CheA
MIETIRKIFIEETSGQLSSIHTVLQNAPVINLYPSIAEDIFLAMHSIKGSGPMFGFENLPLVSHPVEKTFARIKTGQMELSPEIIEKTNDAIKILLDALQRNNDDHLPEAMKNNNLVNFFTEICQ